MTDLDDDFNWDERQCPLPVLVKEHDEDGDLLKIITRRCNESLFTVRTEGRYLLVDGECDSCGPTWRIECGNGHVLVVPDHEADDNYWQIPFDWPLVKAALAELEKSHPEGTT